MRVTAALSQSNQLLDCDETATVPADKIEPGELVFRVVDNLPNVGLAARDLLIVEPRPHGRAATGEFVIATLGDRTFIGRWWAKHGSRAVLGNDFHVLVEAPELQVLFAVTLIARDETR